MRVLIPLVLAGLASPALAGKEEVGIPLVITVVDAETGAPIPFAAVREQQERELHGVNRESGQFSTTVLYPSYNDEILLQKGMALVLEVTAAGYAPQKVDYVMRGRRNKVLVPLHKMVIPPNIGDEPVTPFKRDLPVGGREMSPEELARIEAEMEAAREKRETEEGGE